MATSEHITDDDSSMSDLIANCASIPPALGVGGPAVPAQRSAQPWTVDDACLGTVRDLEDYGA